MLGKDKIIETSKQKNKRLEEKINRLNEYVEESKKKEKSIIDIIPDTQKLNELMEEIKKLEVILKINK